jgi:hypothetical protein
LAVSNRRLQVRRADGDPVSLLLNVPREHFG